MTLSFRFWSSSSNLPVKLVPFYLQSVKDDKTTTTTRSGTGLLLSLEAMLGMIGAGSITK
jgi:hypothetical protein